VLAQEQEEEVMVTSFALRDKTEAQIAAPPAAAPRIAPRPSDTLRRRNRILALMLAMVSASVFVMVLCLILMFHYLQAHHVVPAWI
jgi:ferric-dicitrate binding protein FerR (iron transport regulator)